MHALASFDRCVDRALAIRASSPATSAEQGLQRLRAAVGATDDDWLGLLADDSQQGRRGLCWRLALWRRGGQPQWLGPVLHAQAGQSAAALRREALELALRALN